MATDPLDALPRVHLAHLPTPLTKVRALDARFGCDLWIKRDDATGGAEAGNKIRKLELLLGRAIAERADTVLTCGGVQSNHARATALLCARLGLSCVLFLRVPDMTGHAASPRITGPVGVLRGGNVLLDHLAGAEVHPIDAAQYRERDTLMADVARTLVAAGRKPFIVPEGGSNGLGALGYVLAMREVRTQLDVGLGGGRPFDVVVHACGSGGTAAGVALGAARHAVARHTIAMAVCDDAPTFDKRIRGIVGEARSILAGLPESAPFTVDDAPRGPAYAVASKEQRQLIADVARTSGLVLDPVYTGKAMHGLALAVKRGDIPRGSRVLFLHTGGLPGLLADPEPWSHALA
jgi:D-cysteine desulfhydrase